MALIWMFDPAQPARDGSIALHWAAMAKEQPLSGQKACCTMLAKRGGLSVEQLHDLSQLVPPAVQKELKKMQCSGCGRARQLQEQFKKCSGCEKVRYCVRECQMQHWKEHKKDCKVKASKKKEEKKE